MKEVSIKDLSLKIEEVKETDKSGQKIGRIVGYSAAFNNIDHGMDLIERGAFSRTIKNNPAWLVLKDHDPRIRLGYNEEAKEDSRGLLTVSALNLDVKAAFEQFQLSKMAFDMGGKDAQSIGYRAISADNDPDNPGVRRIKEVKMFEHSFVAFGMNDNAFSTAVKSWMSQKGDVGLDEYTDLFFNHMESIGFGHEEVKQALQSGPAAPASDPDLVHSFERAIAVLKTKKE